MDKARAKHLAQLNYDEFGDAWNELGPEGRAEAAVPLLELSRAAQNAKLLSKLVDLPPFDDWLANEPATKLLLEIYFEPYHTHAEAILQLFEGERSPELLRFFERAAREGPECGTGYDHPNITRRAVWAIAHVIRPRFREDFVADDLAREGMAVMRSLASDQSKAAGPLALRHLAKDANAELMANDCATFDAVWSDLLSLAGRDNALRVWREATFQDEIRQRLERL